MQAEHYEWEDVILDEASQDEWEGMKKSLYFGLGCGVVGFGMLRWRRRGRLIGGGFSDGLSKYASSSSSKPKSSSGGYTFDPVPPPPKPNVYTSFVVSFYGVDEVQWAKRGRMERVIR